jgi:hypothetical protein
MTFQTKKNVLPNPQKAPVNCAEQAHTPLSHGLLKNNGQFKIPPINSLPIHTQPSTRIQH